MDYDYIYDYTYQDITPIPVDQVELLLSDTFEVWKDKFNKAVDAMNVSIGEISQTIKEIPKPGDVPPRNHASTSTEFGLPSTTEYGHPKASNTTPLAPTQNGAIGDDLTIYARADHAHPYGKSTALAESVTVDGVDFDGSRNIHHYGTCSTARRCAVGCSAPFGDDGGNRCAVCGGQSGWSQGSVNLLRGDS